MQTHFHQQDEKGNRKMQFPAGCVFPLENSVGAKWLAESAQRARKLVATHTNNGW